VNRISTLSTIGVIIIIINNTRMVAGPVERVVVPFELHNNDPAFIDLSLARFSGVVCANLERVYCHC